MRYLTILLLAIVLAPAVIANDDPTLDDLDEREAWTLVALHRLGEAIEAYRGDRGDCPGAGWSEISAIREHLEPAHLEEMPAEDGWGNPLWYWCRDSRYAVVSHGSDGVPGSAYGELPDIEESGDDIVWLDRGLERAPRHISLLVGIGSQKRTMADMRSIAIVIESYRVDNDAIPGAPTAGWVEVETLRARVEPVYIRTLPLVDGWGNPFLVWSDGESYRIVSAGRDGVIEHDHTKTEVGRPTQGLDSDIVFGDGVFVQWPQGPQG